MNWTQIGKDCPRAYDEAGGWGFMEENLRELYDFFDEREMYIIIDMYAGKFVSRILDPVGGFIFISDGMYPTRTAAETAAFTAAFHALEKILATKTVEQ